MNETPAVKVLSEEEANYETLGDLLGMDLYEDLEDEADMVIGYIKPAVIIEGDVHIHGDTSSKTLPDGLEGFDISLVAPEHASSGRPHYYVVVLGDLIVEGNLDAVQYHDLLVKGSIKASTIRGHSANIVATGSITADKMVAWQESEEGGVLYGASLETPLWVRVNPYTDIMLGGEHQLVNTHDDAQANALVEATKQVSGEDISGIFDYGLWAGLKRLVTEGNTAQFIEAYRALL